MKMYHELGILKMLNRSDSICITKGYWNTIIEHHGNLANMRPVMDPRIYVATTLVSILQLLGDVDYRRQHKSAMETTKPSCRSFYLGISLTETTDTIANYAK
jgi:hypothetical protein